MPRYEINADYKREIIEVELAQLAGTIFQLLNQNLKSAKDSEEIKHYFTTYLADFTKRYDVVHKKNEELDLENPVMPVISHSKDDLLKFKENVTGINNLLEEVKDQLSPIDYANYSKALRVMLNETDFHLTQLEKGDGDGDRLAA
jgi:hypothetical protein